jgi:TIR domain
MNKILIAIIAILLISDFARRLYNDLQGNNVRCWFAPEHMKIGSKIRESIDTSLRLYDRLLIVLSEHSVESQWVEHEVETALDKE